MSADDRTAVSLAGFTEPYTGISLVINDDGEDIRQGSGFFIGENTLLTAWHVVDDADTLTFLTGAPSVTFAGFAGTEIDPANPLAYRIPTASDMALVTQPTGQTVFGNVGTGSSYAFGLDVYADFQNFLNAQRIYLGDLTAEFEAQTAGFPVDANSGLLTGLTANLMTASGAIYFAAESNGRWVASDVPIGFGGDVNSDGYIDVLLDGGAFGTLDATGGQSGSPIWTTDDDGAHRAFGIAIAAETYGGFLGFFAEPRAAAYEIITPATFSTIMASMQTAGNSQPEGLTNRINGLFFNTGNEFLYGGPFDDILRGFGAATNGADFLVGGTGNDRYIYETGFGTLTIQETEAYGPKAPLDQDDALVLKGISAGDVRMTRYQASSQDLYVYVNDPATGVEDYIRIQGQFRHGDPAVEQIVFDDFTVDLRNGLLLTGDGSRETLYGSGGNDIILGRGGSDSINGFDGNDTLDGGDGSNGLNGGLDNDTYQFGAVWGATYVYEEGGTDTLQFTEHTWDDIRLARDIGVNSGFLKVFMKDTVPSEEIANQFVSVRAHFSDDTSLQVERLTTKDGREINLLGGLELTGDNGADNMAGTAFDDVIKVLGGRDFVYAGAGHDTIHGGTGNDFLYGQGGNDTYVFEAGFGFDTVSEDGRYPLVDESGSVDTIVLKGINPLQVQQVPDISGNLSINILALGSDEVTDSIFIPAQTFNYADDGLLVERISFGGFGSVSLNATAGGVFGSDLADLTPGTNEEDFIQSFAGDDMAFGYGGNDVIDPGIGRDTIDGGDGIDTVDYADDLDGVAIYLGWGFARAPDGKDTLVSIENASGTNGADRLIGDGGDNVLRGGDGDDVIKGKGGSDRFEGGAGDDTIRGDVGDDTILGGSGMDILFGLAGDDYLDGGADRDFIYGGRDADTIVGGSGDDEVRGNLGNDVITGGDGADDLRGGGSNDDLSGEADNDFLFGENGRDRLDGGAGNDVLTGGAGSGVLDGQRDVFVFASNAAGSGGFDRIKDFEDGLDQIDLTAFGFTDFDTEVDVLASQRTGGLRIDFGGGDILFVEGFDKGDFDGGDVVLA